MTSDYARTHSLAGCLVLPLMTEKVLRVVHIYSECFRLYPLSITIDALCYTPFVFSVRPFTTRRRSMWDIWWNGLRNSTGESTCFVLSKSLNNIERPQWKLSFIMKYYLYTFSPYSIVVHWKKFHVNMFGYQTFIHTKCVSCMDEVFRFRIAWHFDTIISRIFFVWPFGGYINRELGPLLINRIES